MAPKWQDIDYTQFGNPIYDYGGMEFDNMGGFDIAPMRQQTIFGQSPQNGVQGPPPISMADRYRQLYQPQNEAQDRFNALLGQYPQRTPPSTGRKIGASLMGLRNVGKKNVGAADLGATMQLQDRWMDKPYYEGREDWMAQMEPVTKAADLERQYNQNERLIANQIINQEMAQRKQDEVERKNKSEEEIRRFRAQVYDYKARNPNFRFYERGPYIMAENPATGQVTNTGIPSGWMTEYDRETFRAGAAMDRVIEAGNQAQKTEVVRQGGRMELEGARAGNRIALEEAKKRAGTGGNTAESAAQWRRAQEIKNSFPQLAPFISLGSNNRFGVALPKDTFWGFGPTKGPDQAQLDAIESYIYLGGNRPTRPGSANTGKPSVNQGAQRPPVGTNKVPPVNQSQQGSQGKTPVRSQYSPSRNKTRITYSDGSVQEVDGRQ